MKHDSKLREIEGLKSLNRVTEPDPRFGHFVVFDEKINRSRPLQLKDRFAVIAEIKLRPEVPVEIQIHFATAKNLLLYSWFVYRFIAVAEMHACSTVEMALKKITGKKNWYLKRLLEHAVDKGWIVDEGFRRYREILERRREYAKMVSKVQGEQNRESKGRNEYVAILAQTIPSLRNMYAHGSDSIHPGGYDTLEICAEIINQLPWPASSDTWRSCPSQDV